MKNLFASKTFDFFFLVIKRHSYNQKLYYRKNKIELTAKTPKIHQKPEMGACDCPSAQWTEPII